MRFSIEYRTPDNMSIVLRRWTSGFNVRSINALGRCRSLRGADLCLQAFARCSEEEVYENRLAGTVQNNLGLEDIALIAFSLALVTFRRPYYTPHFLANLEYWFKQVQFEQRFRVRRNTALFEN